MIHHRMKRNDFRLGSGAMVTIEYWTDPTSVNVAAFDASGHQASRVTYKATLEADDRLTPEMQEAFVHSLANELEYDLTNNPELYVRTH